MRVDEGLPKLKDITDWFLPEDEDKDFIVYPGAFIASGELLDHAKRLRDNIRWRITQDVELTSGRLPADMRVVYSDKDERIAYRAHRQRTVDGVMFILRRISSNVPEITSLGLPPEVVRVLTSHRFGEQGGLVIISGAAGHGKSTTCASTVMARVKTFGHFCLTVEDPPEFDMHGDHPAKNGRIGKVVQVPANRDNFAGDLRDALRCYPSNMRGSMLVIGEIRDGETAARALRESVNGQLVFLTMHATSPIGALERLLGLGKETMGEEANSLLQQSTRAVIHQRLENRRLSVEFLFSLYPSSGVGARIKHGNLGQLSTDVEQQKTWLQTGKLLERLFAESDRSGGKS